MPLVRSADALPTFASLRPSGMPGVAKPFALVGDAAPPPSTFDQRVVLAIPEPEDQGSSSACEGEGHMGAAFVAAGCRGKYGSADAAYTMARILERQRRTDPLPDTGCNERDLFAAMLGRMFGGWGIVSEERWPLRADHINDDLPWDVFQAAQPIKWYDCARITSTGDQLIADLSAALWARYGCTYVQAVDQSFFDWQGSAVWPGLRGPVLGYHCQQIVAYEPGAVTVRGSYGTGWADGGYIRIATSFLASPGCMALDVIKAAPVLAA